MNHFDGSIKVDLLVSGKLRRYHHLSLWQHILMPAVVWPNLRDGLLVVIGFVQSFFKLLVWRPDVVFTKGGYVCLPIGLAARLLRIPVVIHDSDAHPGLTNRLLAPHATAIATGAPVEYYPYPTYKTTYVGIPVALGLAPLEAAERRRVKEKLGFSVESPLIVITGGGLGAKRLNDQVARELSELLTLGSVFLVSGVGQYDELRALTPQNDVRFQLHSFISDGMTEILGAADVVVTRAGATTLLELAALARPTIIVPNAHLTGGHQLKNAQLYADHDAALVVSETEFQAEGAAHPLTSAVRQIVEDDTLADRLAQAIHARARPRAAEDMAAIIVSAQQ